jgi:hypothetical protein
VNLWLAAGIIAASVAAMVTVMLTLRRVSPAGGHFRVPDHASGVFGFLGAGFAIMLGFVVLLTFEGYSNAKSKSEDEANAVFEQYQVSELFQPQPRRERIQAELVCYARSVVRLEWPAMKHGDRSAVTDGWAETLEREVPASHIVSMREDVAYQQWFERTSTRDDARRQRLLEATNVLPTLLWVMLILAAVGVVGFVFLYADPQERLLGQIVFSAGVTAVVVTSLLAVALLASPFQNENGSVKPSSMSYTLRLIHDEAAQEGVALRLPCDQRGSPTL